MFIFTQPLKYSSGDYSVELVCVVHRRDESKKKEKKKETR